MQQIRFQTQKETRLAFPIPPRYILMNLLQKQFLTLPPKKAQDEQN